MKPISAVAITVVLVAACSGGSDSPTSPSQSGGGSTSYSGVFASGTERGAISVTLGTASVASLAVEGATGVANASSASATGTLTIGSAAPVSVTGSYTSSSNSFTLSGGGLSVQGTTGTKSLSGSVSGTGLSASATMAAVTAGSGATRYCGVYTGPDAGMVDVVVSGATAAASVTSIGQGFGLNGTASGNSVALGGTITEPGTTQTNTITAALTISGTELTGSGHGTLFNQTVDIATSTAGCIADTPPTGPFTSYVGVANNNGQSGTITLVTGSPATGTLIWNGGAPTTLTGTFDAATNKFTMASGNLTVVATASGATLTGNISGAPSPLGGAGIIGLGSSAASPAVRYCGVSTGGVAGKVYFMTSGPFSSGVYVSSSSSLSLGGSTGGPWVYLSSGRKLVFSATGTAGGSYTGTYTNDADATGTWSASTC